MTKKIWIAAALCCLLITAAPSHAGDETKLQSTLSYLKGWVVDEACGKKNANAEGVDCVLKCHEEDGSPLAFYSVERDKLYRIVEPEPALTHIGREITVLGFVDEEKGTIKVGSYVEPGTTRSVIGRPTKPKVAEKPDEGS